MRLRKFFNENFPIYGIPFAKQYLSHIISLFFPIVNLLVFMVLFFFSRKLLNSD